MARMIDAEPIKKFIVDGLNNPDLKKAFGHDAIEILAEIEYAPTVDAEEVVRCKDCEHWHEETGWCNHHSHFIDSDGEACHPWESSQWKMLDPDDFCSWGERRTDNA